jgi:Fur family transcriptional regulator, zinc uptake regulator
MNTWPNGLRKTPARLSILEAYQQSDTPLGVSDLMKHFSDIPVATLYRVVDAFLDQNLITLSDDFHPKENRYVLKDGHSHHVIRCIHCHKTIQLKQCPVHLEDNMEGFKVISHRLEIEGLCTSCQKEV